MHATPRAVLLSLVANAIRFNCRQYQIEVPPELRAFTDANPQSVHDAWAADVLARSQVMPLAELDALIDAMPSGYVRAKVMETLEARQAAEI